MFATLFFFNFLSYIFNHLSLGQRIYLGILFIVCSFLKKIFFSLFSEIFTSILFTVYGGQEATVRTGHGTTDWFLKGKRVRQGCILSPCLFNLHAEYIMRNAGLEEAQAGIKIAGRNINNLRYADDTTLMAESEGELKVLLMKVKEETEKVGLNQHSKNEDHCNWSHHFMGNRLGNSGNSVRHYFGGLQNHCRW